MIGMTEGEMPGIPGGHSGAIAPKPVPLNQGQAWHYSPVKWWILQEKGTERSCHVLFAYSAASSGSQRRGL